MRIRSEMVSFVLVQLQVLIGDEPQSTTGVVGRKERNPTAGLCENAEVGINTSSVWIHTSGPKPPVQLVQFQPGHFSRK